MYNVGIKANKDDNLMPSIIELQLNKQERNLYQIIELNSRSQDMTSFKKSVEEVLVLEKIMEKPDWLVSLLEDLDSREDEFWLSGKAIETRYISLELLLNKAFRAFCGGGLLFEKKDLAMDDGLIRKGYNPDAPHMRWARILKDKIASISESFPGRRKTLYVGYICNGEPFGIDFPKYVELMKFRREHDWFAIEQDDFVEWYVGDLDKLTPNTSAFAQFINDASCSHEKESFSQSNYKDRFPFREFHPLLTEKGLDIFTAHVSSK